MQPGKTFGFFTLTSFSTDPEAIANFKSTSDSRTVFELIDGVGYKLDSFSKYAGEAEVLVECVSIKEVVRSMKFDPKAAAGSGDLAGIVSKLTLMGEVPSGLHYVVARSRPGVALLAGSPAKAREKAVYDRAELEKLQLGPLPELVFDPIDDDPDADGADPAEQSELGSGAFATTYRMRSADGAARYAVKTFKLKRIKGAGISPEDLEREVRILGALRHRHVIRYVGSRVTKSEFSIVMELAGGGSLAARIQAGAPPAGELLRLARELAGGLEYVHGEGVVHRDVKPENILLSDAGAVKLVDFGLATVLTSSMGSCVPARAGGGGPGSPAYSSPEKAQGHSYGSKDDMWAAGCVLAELATGTRLRGPVWSDGEEVRARRAELLLQAPRPPR
jgi:tRNA A-37 threonylcarbamoyl transferase component Bud32